MHPLEGIRVLDFSTMSQRPIRDDAAFRYGR